ncbi:uncharacterized protein HKW66_Vig0110240 [Vigna angularis]|uniref:Pyrrolo-quinoline quinone repeat domain-containing protein n=2 Tax=Phaseolus angularis TaxID=3914 RepID=A0A8T0KXZ1_PHAAN|nr:uncharacterized protein LOC108327170 [Vigna angularis]KAG2404102.1 uncharacterized protein HKW66_Vig0110240 [Vigna angularis]BAT83387.1 hypothetical protein VIGAN_04052700 [Vigna angularis var. angularis]
MAKFEQITCFIIFMLVICLLTSSLSEASHFQEKTQNWLNHGGDIYNRRYASMEQKISVETVSNLSLKWKFEAGKDITATPAIFDGILYFPSWNGELYAVRTGDGSLVWKQNLQNLTGLSATGFVPGVNWTVSRATPTIADDDVLLVGIYGPALVIALKRSTGELVWKTRLDSHNTSAITMSGTYYNGAFYVGTSSQEEILTPEECCTFRGSFSKLDVKSGAILWQTFMVPDNHGKKGEYAGAAVWGSSPSIDASRNHIYIATGNLYSAPLEIRQCQEKENNATRPTHPDDCVEPENHSDSILALDLDDGKIEWYHQFGGYDVWFLSCSNLSTPNCPPGPNPDADFGEAPIILTIDVNKTKHDVVVAVQKSGFAWALHRDDGKLIWSTEAGPGGVAGGGTWGAASDIERVYTNIANSDHKNFTLRPSKKTTRSGGWVAMEAKSGKILWSTENPSNASSYGPVSVANGIVFAGSVDVKGPIYAINAETGSIVWSYETGSSVYGGLSVSDGCIYVGNGYKIGFGLFLGNYTAGTSLFAFCV